MDGPELDAPSRAGTITANEEPPHKKRRINRSIKTCSSCRRSKARCEVHVGKIKCQRCFALGTNCDLPPQQGADDTAPSALGTGISERLNCIEYRLEKLTTLIQTVAKNGGIGQASRAALDPTASAQTLPLDQSSSNHSESQSQYINRAVRPVLLVRNLQTQFFGPKRDFSDEQLAVGSVLSAGIINTSLAQALLRIFVKRYGGWVSIKCIDDLPPAIERESPLLFSTACILAAKHVPRVQKETVDSMYVLVRRLVSSVVLTAPPLDYPSLQALTLLSLFTPTIQSAMPIDSWLISGMAMNHAVLAFDLAANCSTASDDLAKRLKQLRIWNALCLINVQFSIGNGRPSAVQARFVDQCALILEIPNAAISDGRLFAEVLLYTKTEALLTNPSKIPYQDYNGLLVADISAVKTKWSHIFDLHEGLLLKIGYWYCHLLLYRATWSSTDTQSDVFKTAALRTSSDILNLFQELEFSIVLDMPDHFFFMVIYAALTLCKFAIGHHLISSTESCLRDLAPNDEHIAYRFGTILSEIRRKAAAAGAERTYTGEDHGRSLENEPPQLIADSYSGGNDWRWDAFLSWSNLAYEETEIVPTMQHEHIND